MIDFVSPSPSIRSILKQRNQSPHPGRAAVNRRIEESLSQLLGLQKNRPPSASIAGWSLVIAYYPYRDRITETENGFMEPKYLSKFRRWFFTPLLIIWRSVIGSLGYVVVSNICYFHPYLGKWSNLTNIIVQMCWNPPTNTGAAAICGDNYRNLK